VQAKDLIDDEDMSRYLTDKQANFESTCDALREQIQLPDGGNQLEVIEVMCMCVFACVLYICVVVYHYGCYCI